MRYEPEYWLGKIVSVAILIVLVLGVTFLASLIWHYAGFIVQESLF